jgi:FlaA1/EpsC-like NDP-sugar epimerase
VVNGRKEGGIMWAASEKPQRGFQKEWVPRSAIPLVLVDTAAWVGAMCVATMLRLERWVPTRGLGGVLLAAVAIQLVLGFFVGLYRGRWCVGRFEEAVSVTLVAVAAAAGATLADVQWGQTPRTVPAIAGVLAITDMQAARYLYRLLMRRRRRPQGTAGERMLVFGAGAGAQMVLPSLMNDPGNSYVPVALLDDYRGLRSRSIYGIHVVGTRDDLVAAARRYKATVLLIAIPSADGQVVRDISDLAREAGMRVMVLPRVADMVGSFAMGDIRDVSESDLLGRRVSDLDLDAIARYVTGKRVLVTGAGGSIGSELCRQLYRYAPATLVMLDRDESALHGVQLSIGGRAMLDGDDTVLADIRDRDAVFAVFDAAKPEVVFHAAALKHLPMLERFPDEAWKTNVVGTQHVLDAAAHFGVERFINISTDKAADPISVLGWSKRVTERLVASAAQRAASEVSGGTYVSVRFGNVLGSRGSVLVSFRDQISKGGPVTVTDPEVTRYFMMVEEAVALTIQAGAIGRGGEVLILDMGQPVRIADVARHLIEASGKRVDIVYTGLRTGEKLDEDLFGHGEIDVRPYHQGVSHVSVPPYNAAELATVRAGVPACSRETLVELAKVFERGVESPATT